MHLLEQAAVFLLTAVLLVPLFQRLKLGAVLGYLGAGMLIGPWGLGMIGEVESTLQFAEFGVVLLLFLVGLELQPSRLWVLRRPVFGLGGTQVTCDWCGALRSGPRVRPLVAGCAGRRLWVGDVLHRPRARVPRGAQAARHAPRARGIRGAPVPGPFGHPAPRPVAAAQRFRSPRRRRMDFGGEGWRSSPWS